MKVALIAALSAALVAVGASALPSAIGQQAGSSQELTKPVANTTTTERNDDSAARRERHRAREQERERARERAREARADDHSTTTTREPGEDLRGPCDEAEHAGDPRCTGTGTQRPADDGVNHDVGDDRGDDGMNHDVGDDRGGDHGGERRSNSGPGSVNSGPGSVNSGREREGGEDHSGHGHGGGDDD